MSSGGHLLSPVVFDDLHFDFRPYDPWLAYGQSKTANVLFALAATARWSSDGITANALNPGVIKTGLQRHISEEVATPPDLQKTPQQGAATAVLLATSPLLEGVGGRYFEGCNEAERVPASYGRLSRGGRRTRSILRTRIGSGTRRSTCCRLTSQPISRSLSRGAHFPGNCRAPVRSRTLD